MKKVFLRILLLLGAVFAVIQIYPPVVRDNPPVTAEIDAPPEVMRILRRACYDCHSNQTRWPWYSYVAPASWFVTGHVHHARSEMNFSAWNEMPEMNRILFRGEIVDQVRKERMPMPSYLWLHRSAKISPADQEILRRWMTGEEMAGPESP